MNLVQDTDVFVAALKSGAGASRKFIRLLLSGKHLPLMGDKLWFEYLDLVSRAGRLWADGADDRAERLRWLDDFAAVCQYVRVTRLWRPNLVDEGDNHVMELCIAGNAAALMTFNLADFKAATFAPPGMEILPPGEFLTRYAL